jgi:hypothetical protein
MGHSVAVAVIVLTNCGRLPNAGLSVLVLAEQLVGYWRAGIGGQSWASDLVLSRT